VAVDQRNLLSADVVSLGVVLHESCSALDTLVLLTGSPINTREPRTP
jgi:hypothetical protein